MCPSHLLIHPSSHKRPPLRHISVFSFCVLTDKCPPLYLELHSPSLWWFLVYLTTQPHWPGSSGSTGMCLVPLSIYQVGSAFHESLEIIGELVAHGFQLSLPIQVQHLFPTPPFLSPLLYTQSPCLSSCPTCSYV